MMRGRTLLCLSVVIAAALVWPAMASAALTNEYGMGFAGQAACLGCHDGSYGLTVHGRFAKTGLVPAAPIGWTVFKAAGDPATAGAATPNSGLAWYSAGGSYDVSLQWITLGDYAGGAATEYLFFNGNTSGSKNNPWNLVEGLIAEPTGEWLVGSEDPEGGLYDVVYGCQRCHMLGTTNATANSTATAAVPNPVVSIPATYTTALQWARADTKTAADFNTDATVSEPGMSIQCEACHGTGFKADALTTKHWNSGTQLSHRIPTGTVAPGGILSGTNVATLGQSQVCGQCHGSYVNVANTLGIYGYTPNLPMRLFGDINGLSGGASYTYTPTEAEFLAAPTKYFLFPNGSNAKGNHYYYNEWASSGHAYRGALGSTGSPDIMPGGKAGRFNSKTSALSCAACHTGENYLRTKGAAIMADTEVVTGVAGAGQVQAGYMGQECIVCHDPHPSGVGVESNIREADAAGVRSNTGRTTANASMCEDCHNWQLEVQGLGTTFAPTTTGRGPSHPQRELLHGRSVMFEVADTGEYMPGAKCQECHMPKTNKNANRYSHGMHIMMPGDAKVWNAAAGATYKGEDSCSGCHAGETRDELQANIDGWQSELAVAAAEASAAIDAAKLRSEFAAASGKELAGRAFVNWKAYVNDGSGGVHNPRYISRGLAAAKTMADSVGGSFDQLYASSRITIGTLGSIVGHVDNGNGTSAVGASVALEMRNGTGWVQMGSAKSDDNGNVAFMISPSLGNHTYRLRWDRCSNNVADKYSAARVVSVVKIASQVTAAPSATTIYAGRYFYLRGRVAPAAPGQYITIQAKKYGGSWYTLARIPLSAYSSYSRAIRPSSRGYWYYRVYYGGTSTVAAAWSPTARVRVR